MTHSQRSPIDGVVVGRIRLGPILDLGARLAREAVRIEPGTIAHVGADVAARTAGLAQGEVVAVHHTYWSVRSKHIARMGGGSLLVERGGGGVSGLLFWSWWSGDTLWCHITYHT